MKIFKYILLYKIYLNQITLNGNNLLTIKQLIKEGKYKLNHLFILKYYFWNNERILK